MRQKANPPILTFNENANRFNRFSINMSKYDFAEFYNSLIGINASQKEARPPYIVIYTNNPERTAELIPDVVGNFEKVDIKTYAAPETSNESKVEKVKVVVLTYENGSHGIENLKEDFEVLKEICETENPEDYYVKHSEYELQKQNPGPGANQGSDNGDTDGGEGSDGKSIYTSSGKNNRLSRIILAIVAAVVIYMIIKKK